VLGLTESCSHLTGAAGLECGDLGKGSGVFRPERFAQAARVSR
jgi:hypothetical protein